jgi:histidinol-phosphate aminotransferase
VQTITLIALGKLNADYYAKAAAEYAKRLSAYCRLNIVELPEEPIAEKNASPAVIGMLRKVIAPYPIPVPCADIAAQALSPESVSLMHRRAAQCVMRKCELEVALEDLDGVEAVYPSASNFLLVRFVDAARVFTALRDRGIILRDQSRQPTLENCIRITVGTKDENERLLTELEEILKEAA